MLIQHNYLRLYRRRAGLSQADLASISNMRSRACVARCEKGISRSPIELLLVYHILFNVPIEIIFERQKEEVLSSLNEKLKRRIGQLQALKQRPKIARRLAYLEETIRKLPAKNELV